MRVSLTFVAVLLATATTALPSGDDVVPEFAPAEELTQEEFQAAHAEAKATVDQLMQSGKSQDECAKLASATLSEIKNGVSASQKMLDVLPSGSKCKDEGMAMLKAAEKANSKDSSANNAAQAAAAAAKVAPVKLSSLTASELKSGDCTAFLNDPSYTKARSAHKAASKHAAKTKGAADNAAKTLKLAHDQQRAAVEKCNCDTKKAHDKAWKTASANTAENAKSWRKAQLMKCVLKGTSMTSCNIPPVPTVKKPKMASTATCKSCKTEVGINFRGPGGNEDVRKDSASNVADCSAKCDKNAACQYFVFVKKCNWQCYLDRYPDLSKYFGAHAVGKAAQHYANHGKKEGRDCTCKVPSSQCNWQCYLDRYSDLSKYFGAHAVDKAAQHYANHGKKEGRDCTCKGMHDCWLKKNLTHKQKCAMCVSGNKC